MVKDKIVQDNIVIENASIGFRNFSGKETKFNPAGKKNFCVFLENELGQVLEDDGWNVRWLDPKEEGDEKTPYLQVAVSYDNIPPKILMISSGNQTLLDAASVNILDWAEIKNVDLIMRPYNWDVNGKSGVKAYVRSMYVTIVEDEFADKYRVAPDETPDVF